MTYLSERSLQRMTELLSSKAFEALDMVDRQSLAIDWEEWGITFNCLEALGLIEELPATQLNLYIHRYSFTKLGATIWKFKVTKQMQEKHKMWWHNLLSSKK